MGCCGSTLARLSRAAAKRVKSHLRQVGLLPSSDKADQRLQVCVRCQLHTLREGQSFCGRPLLENIRRSADQGCGCPLLAKSRDPDEHCPVDRDHQAATIGAEGCTCKWCESVRAAHRQMAVAG